MSAGRALVKVAGLPGARGTGLAPGPAAARLPGVISKLRPCIAVAVALVVTLFTLGRVPVSWTGGSGAQDGAEDPGRAVAARRLGGPAV
jgi:hypothetical protein